MAVAYLGLGSNSGDKVGFVRLATKMITESKDAVLIRSSSLYETEPWGNKNQEPFINAVIEIKTLLSPEDLLELCFKIEKKLGRNRENEEKWGPRTADIDILLYDDLVMTTKELTIPHKYMHKRAFVLVPLLELIPKAVHPKLKKTFNELYFELENPEEVTLYGARQN